MSSGSERKPARAWIGWLVGAAMLAALVIAVAKFSELKDLAKVAERARPAWITVAILFQAGTYLAQGSIWRVICRAADASLGFFDAWRMALGKLFIDQALPSGGVSGTLVVVKALGKRGISDDVVASGVIVNMSSFYFAYALGLAAALVIVIAHHSARRVVIGGALVFTLVSAAIALGVLVLAGPASRRLARRLHRFERLKKPLEFLEQSEPSFARRPLVLGSAVALQLAIIALDAGTIVVLLLALGEQVPIDRVFAAFMLASLFRTIGVAPGGLGTFEAASVVALRSAGVTLPIALAATLLYRGLSFWLPMLPGAWASRSMTRR